MRTTEFSKLIQVVHLVGLLWASSSKYADPQVHEEAFRVVPAIYATAEGEIS